MDQFQQFWGDRVRHGARLVRMHTDDREQAVLGISAAHFHRFDAVGQVAADHPHLQHPGGTGALKHSSRLAAQIGIVGMTMTVDVFH